MKNLLSIIAVCFLAFQVNAQVGVGTNTPNASAQLDVTSTSKGMLVPRMTATERGDIVSPAEGLLVYQTTAPAGFYVYKSGAWVSILDNSIGYLPLTGGALTGALTGTTANFATSSTSPNLIGGTGTTSSLTYKTTTGVGTTGADHIFKVGNNGATEAMRILNSGNVGIGQPAPSYKLDVNGTARIVTTPTITNATSVLVKDPSTNQISEQVIPAIAATGIAKFIINTTQGTITAGNNVIYNTTDVNTISSYVSLNTSTGVITLQPGTYIVTGSVGGVACVSGGNSTVVFGFHNGTSYIGQGGQVSSGNYDGRNGVPEGPATQVITVASTTNISLKIAHQQNVSAISDRSDFQTGNDILGRAWCMVQRIGN